MRLSRAVFFDQVLRVDPIAFVRDDEFDFVFIGAQAVDI